MPVFVVTCPICKKKYKLTVQDTAILAQKNFTCHNCNYSAPFSHLIKGLPQPQPVTRPGVVQPNPQAGSQHFETKVFPMGAGQVRAYLSVVGNASKFVLNPGIYILGRKSSDSNATLQLAPDISMSRQHARLSVQMIGRKIMAQIQSLKASNPVFVNGSICPVEKQIILKSGDRLQLGATLVLFTI